MDQDKFSLLKSHVEAYTRKDGAVVGAHDTKVQKHPRVIQSAIDTLTPNGDQEWTHGKNSSSIALGAHRAADSGDVLGDHGFSYDDDSYETMSHPDGHTATIKDGTLTLKHGVAKPKLSEGDSVKVTGNVQGAGKKGVIHETAPSGHFHIVKHADGSKSSYHESNLAAHDPDEDEDEDEDDDRHGMLKSHIDAFTRKDGTTVQAHDDKRVAAAPKADPYGHPNVVGKPSKMVNGNWTKETGYKETEHTGKPTDAHAIHFAGKKYLSSGKTGTSSHDGTPTRAFNEDDGTDEGGHRVWLDDKARVHADDTTEVKKLRAKYEAHSGPADGEVGHEEHKQYGAQFKKGDKVKDRYGKTHDVISHSGPEVKTSGGSFHPTKLFRQ